MAQAIRAIDPAEVLAKASMWKGPGETPHRYSPDYMAQGDCQVCGHTREAHQSRLEAYGREKVQEAVPEGNLFIDSDGDLCIAGRKNNLVACLATDDADGNWQPLNPDVFPEIVRRWNAHTSQTSGTVAATLLINDDFAISKMAEAIHDGPLGADDHLFSAARPQGAWCVEVVRAALRALKGDE